MLRINRQLVWSIFLILVVIINLMNVNIVLADDTTPPPTEEPTQPPVESTETPVVETPAPTDTPVSTEETPAAEEQVQAPALEEAVPAELLTQLPENTDLVVLDENGNPVSLASQEAVSILEEADPIWCPASQAIPTPGANGCTTNQTITSLLALMQTNAGGVFSQDGIIYLEKPVGQGFTTPLILDNSAASLSGSFATLSAFNLIIRGGWNGNNPGTFSANTNFGVSGGNEGYVLIGSAANPWAGNITLQDIKVTNVSVANSVTVYTSSGNIVLSNVDVTGQKGTNYTAYLDSNSGNIIVQVTSSFDGDNTGGGRNKGFYAETNSGSISITGGGPDPTFKDARGTDPANYNGATLSAPTVTLTNVISQDNDGNGIEILNANVVTLNNVTSGVNASGQGNGLSGVLVNGTGSTIVTITGGSFSRNGRYGLEILSSGAVNIVSNPSYSTNTLGNLLFSDSAPPTISPHGDETVEATSSAGAAVNYTSPATSDATDGAGTASCSPASGSSFALGNTTVTCTASDTAGNAATPTTFVVHVVDTTAPTLNLPANITANTTDPAGAVVSYPASANDIVDGSVPTNCAPASGSTFLLGSTTVNCSAVDSHSNSANGSFIINVQDPDGPTLNLPANIVTEATSPAGAVVDYSASATDIADGSVPVTCLPASGSVFPLGPTTVNCTASDSDGNTNNASFLITIEETTSPTVSSTSSSASSSQTASGIVIPITGGGLIDLDCLTSTNAFGVMVTFHNLCDYQGAITEVGKDALPGPLPNGYSHVKGLNVQVLENGQTLNALPDQTGVQMDFPLPSGSQDQFAVLYWNNGQWVEINQPMNDGALDKILATDAGNEFYKMSSSNGGLYKILTAELTGIFVLVKK